MVWLTRIDYYYYYIDAAAASTAGGLTQTLQHWLPCRTLQLWLPCRTLQFWLPCRHCCPVLCAARCAGSRGGSPPSSLLWWPACTVLSGAAGTLPGVLPTAAAVVTQHCSSTSSTPQLMRGSCLAGIAADALLEQSLRHLARMHMSCCRVPAEYNLHC
jgi:hypothetical protein